MKKRSRRAHQNSENVQDDLKRLHTVDGLSWDEIAALPQYSGIPPGTLCGIVTQGYIPPKWGRKLGITRKRVRITAQVDPDTKAAVHAAAEARGISVAELVRRAVEHLLNGCD
jgi:hypothetical protein